MEYTKKEYLNLLSKRFKNIDEVTEEIINLKAILNLPKGTEVFLSDVHGEYEPFVHILNNGAGKVKAKINAAFGDTISKKEKSALATLIYYPKERLKIVKEKTDDMEKWYDKTIRQLVQVCRQAGNKYTRSKVRKALPKNFDYIIDEMLHAPWEEDNKEQYYDEIVKTIIEIDRADEFIEEISASIKQMSIDHLHIVGDIFDRGIHPDLIIDKLMTFHSLDIQWGNHDILWMGAACGNTACIANVIRICARYNNIRLLEDTYGINIRPLSMFALKNYPDEPAGKFLPKVFDYSKYQDSDKTIMARIQKAIMVIQLKLEGQLIKKHPEYEMDDRLMLDKIDYKKGTITIYGKEYELNDTDFPTINPKKPYELTSEEKELVERLQESFTNSPKLNHQIKFLYDKGSIYKIFNSNLLLHACIPMTEDGEFKKVKIFGKELAGKEYLDFLNIIIEKAYFTDNKDKKDFMWYLWCNQNSPFFGKERMTTFEQYFIDDKTTHKEKQIGYYHLTESEDICLKILKEFEVEDEYSHIINGHVPVKAKDGKSPIKANGRLLRIDGGLAKSFREKTGEAGYTLSYNSYGFVLNANKPFESIQKAVEDESDLKTEIIIDDRVTKRKMVGDTDIGKELKEQIEALMCLLQAYRDGKIPEKTSTTK